MMFSRPTTSFDSNDVPPAPDYANENAWVTRAEVCPANESDPLAAERPADVFFVHPTSYFGGPWNAAYDDVAVAANTDELVVGVQAAPFQVACRIFAPRYRQMTYGAFSSHDITSARAAAAVAYLDIEAAFDHYLHHYNMGRPFFLASHSQGTLHATRLLQGRLDGSAEAGRCVAAYLIGMAIPITIADNLKSFRPSAAPEQTHTLVSWNLKGAATDGSQNYISAFVGPGLWTPHGEYISSLGCILLQTSPLTWVSPHSTATGHTTSSEAPRHLGVAIPVCKYSQLEPAKPSQLALNTLRLRAGNPYVSPCTGR